VAGDCSAKGRENMETMRAFTGATLRAKPPEGRILGKEYVSFKVCTNLCKYPVVHLFVKHGL
jgi:hypothetical protein